MKPLSDKEFVKIVDDAIIGFKGDAHILSSSIGMLALCRKFGWKPIYLIYNKSTVKKYEKVLGVDIRELFTEEGEIAHRSIAFKLMKKAGNFWKSVKGEITGIRSPEIR